jgi:hypothetical protein
MKKQKPSNRISQTRKSSPTNPFIFTKKAPWMQRIASTVGQGAQHYIQGTTKLAKAAFRCADLHKRYKVNSAKHQDLKARKIKQPVARWFAWFDGADDVHWVLLVDRIDESNQAESWRNVTTDRIQLTGYELVRKTRPGAKAPSWTWQYSRSREHALRDQIVSAIRFRQDVQVAQIIHSLTRTIGFAGARQQVKKCFALMRSEWKRTRSHSEVLPEIPKFIGFLQRVGDKGELWSELMKGVSQNGPT